MSDCDAKLSIAILVVGTRGDVQPFMAVARRLQASLHIIYIRLVSGFRLLIQIL